MILPEFNGFSNHGMRLFATSLVCEFLDNSFNITNDFAIIPSSPKNPWRLKMAIFTWQTWLVITLVCGMIELFWFNTYTLCLAIAAFLTMLATIFGLVSGAWQAITFVVLAGLLVLADEKMFKSYLAQMKNKNETQPQQSEEPKQN